MRWVLLSLGGWFLSEGLIDLLIDGCVSLRCLFFFFFFFHERGTLLVSFFPPSLFFFPGFIEKVYIGMSFASWAFACGFDGLVGTFVYHRSFYRRFESVRGMS